MFHWRTSYPECSVLRLRSSGCWARRHRIESVHSIWAWSATARHHVLPTDHWWCMDRRLWCLVNDDHTLQHNTDWHLTAKDTSNGFNGGHNYPKTGVRETNIPHTNLWFVVDLLILKQQQEEEPFYGPLIRINPRETLLSQRRDLLEQPLDFYQPDVLPAYSVKAVQENSVCRLVFYRHAISTPCLTNRV